MIKSITSNLSTESEIETLAKAYHRLSKAMDVFSDFENFRSALNEVLEKDSRFSLSIVEAADVSNTDSPQLESGEDLFSMEQVMLPLQQNRNHRDFLQVDGNCEPVPFSAADLHLLGALARLLTVLLQSAETFGENQRRAEILQFLIDQLPIGVIAIAAKGSVLTANALVWRLLKQPQACSHSDGVPELEMLKEATASSGEAHLEIDQQLLFAKRGLFAPTESNPVAIYLIYDLSEERLLLEQKLERHHFRSRCLNKPASIAMLQVEGNAGQALAQLRAVMNSLDPENYQIKAVDAYSAIALIDTIGERQLRNHLRKTIDWDNASSMRLSIADLSIKDYPDGKALIETVQQQLLPSPMTLRRQFLAFEPFTPAFKSLEMLLQDEVRLRRCKTVEEICLLLQSGLYDGAIIDLDSANRRDLFQNLPDDAENANEPLTYCYLSTRQKAMLTSALENLPPGRVINKPFDKDQIGFGMISPTNC